MAGAGGTEPPEGVPDFLPQSENVLRARFRVSRMDAGRGCGNLASLSGGPVSRQRRSGPGADHPCRRNSGPLRRGEFGHISRFGKLLRTAHLHGCTRTVCPGRSPRRNGRCCGSIRTSFRRPTSSAPSNRARTTSTTRWSGRWSKPAGSWTSENHGHEPPRRTAMTFPRRSRVELAVGLLLGLGCQSEQSAVPRPTTLPAPAPPAPTPPEEPATNYLVPGFPPGCTSLPGASAAHGGIDRFRGCQLVGQLRLSEHAAADPFRRAAGRTVGNTFGGNRPETEESRRRVVDGGRRTNREGEAPATYNLEIQGPLHWRPVGPLTCLGRRCR